MVDIALVFGIRRICKNQVESGLPGIEIEEAVGIHRLHDAFNFGHAEILADAADTSFVFINENGGLRPSAQSLDTHATRAREKVEHAGAGNTFAQTGKNGPSDTIHRRSEPIGRGFERTTACAAGNDSHKWETQFVGVGVGDALFFFFSFFGIWRRFFKSPPTSSPRRMPTNLSSKSVFGRERVPVIENGMCE